MLTASWTRETQRGFGGGAEGTRRTVPRGGAQRARRPIPGLGFCRMGFLQSLTHLLFLKFWPWLDWGGGSGSGRDTAVLCILGILLKPTCWGGCFVL